MVGFLMVYLVVPRVARLLDLSSAMSFEIYQADFQLTRPINYWKRCFYTTYSNGRDDKPIAIALAKETAFQTPQTTRNEMKTSKCRGGR